MTARTTGGLRRGLQRPNSGAGSIRFLADVPVAARARQVLEQALIRRASPRSTRKPRNAGRRLPSTSAETVQGKAGSLATIRGLKICAPWKFPLHARLAERLGR